MNASRRTFITATATAAGAALITRATMTAAQPAAAASPPAAKPKVPGEITLQQTGWNIASTRFVDAPAWTWAALPGAAEYVVMLAAEDDRRARTIRLTEPRYDMTAEWASLPDGWLTMIVWAVDAKGRPLCAAWPNAAGGKRFCKSPGFDGRAQEPLDWAASLHRVMSYLLAPARDHVHAFEGDMPRSCWSSCEDSISGQRRLTAFPALHHPSFILAYLAYARAFPDHPQAREATRQARQYGDWLLTHRQPADWRCALFPFSTIENGQFEGHLEGAAITLFRAARVGGAMLELARHFGDERYLAYAKHLADKFVELQRADGSWPYRVDPRDGSVVADYTSAAITPARLLGMVEAVAPAARYTAAREKAERWVMENPVRTRRWQGMFEDVAAQAPYRNLHHMDVNETIWYLVHYRRTDRRAMAIAEELNRFIEDQFVIWQPADKAVIERTPTPIVLEQYACYRPMECHTALWAESLLALHRATGRQDYLTKAIAAGNTVVRSQNAATGAYSTWGYDPRFERPLLSIDWSGVNAMAVHGLLRLRDYVARLPASRDDVQPL